MVRFIVPRCINHFNNNNEKKIIQEESNLHTLDSRGIEPRTTHMLSEFFGWNLVESCLLIRPSLVPGLLGRKAKWAQALSRRKCPLGPSSRADVEL